MPDIAMCAQSTCERAEECYRYRAVPDADYQAWMMFQPVGCAEFIPIERRPTRTMQEIDERMKRC